MCRPDLLMTKTKFNVCISLKDGTHKTSYALSRCSLKWLFQDRKEGGNEEVFVVLILNPGLRFFRIDFRNVPTLCFYLFSFYLLIAIIRISKKKKDILRIK